MSTMTGIPANSGKKAPSKPEEMLDEFHEAMSEAQESGEAVPSSTTVLDAARLFHRLHAQAPGNTAYA